MRQLLILIFSAGLLFQCKLGLSDLELVYETGFENTDEVSLLRASYTQFNGSQVIGNYHNGGFDVVLDNLSKHNQVLVSFDLYIHDSWDGNADGVGGPDQWSLSIDPGVADEFITNQFVTTFSNTGCDPIRCLHQAYPAKFPFNHFPKTDATNRNLPGICSLADDPQGTTHYQIEKSFYHTGKNIVIRFSDNLIQSNALSPKCDESWSLDNLKIYSYNY
jgi:hypothetical protein